MAVRMDKFKVGDKVRLVPNSSYMHQALDFKKNNPGKYDWLTVDGIYTISALEDVGKDFNHAVGHTQFLKLEEDYNSHGKPNWSGAYWELVANVRRLLMTKAKKEDQKKIVKCVLELDHKKLYAPLVEAIAYLQQVCAEHSDKPDLSIEEHWTGYEDMELRFTYTRLETDEEFAKRMQLKAEEDARHSAMLKEAARKKKIQDEIERLRKQL